MLPTRRADLTTRIIDGEIVILDRASGKVHHLNSTASWIWELCDGKTSIEDISARVAATFEVSADQVHGDVMNTIASLQTLGLLKV